MTWAQEIMAVEEKSRAEGRAEGIGIGVAKGREEGRKEGRLSTVLNMLKRKMALQDIAEIAEVSPEQVAAIAKENGFAVS